MSKVTLNQELDEFLRLHYNDIYDRIRNGEIWLLTLEIQDEYYRWLEE